MGMGCQRLRHLGLTNQKNLYWMGYELEQMFSSARLLQYRGCFLSSSQFCIGYHSLTEEI